MLLRRVVTLQHIQEEQSWLETLILQIFRNLKGTYIFYFLAYAFDGGSEILPDLDALISKKACDDEFLNILDSKQPVNIWPIVLIKAVNEISILDQCCKP